MITVISFLILENKALLKSGEYYHEMVAFLS